MRDRGQSSPLTFGSASLLVALAAVSSGCRGKARPDNVATSSGERSAAAVASSAPSAGSSSPPPTAASSAPLPLPFPPPGSTHTATRSVDRIGTVSLAPDGRTLVTLGVGNVVHRWDLAVGKLLGFDDPSGGPSATARAGAVAALPGRLFARCDGKTVGIFRVDDGARVRELPPARLPCGWLFASPDGTTLFVTSTKGSIDIVDSTTGETRRALKVSDGYTRIVASPDGKAAFTLDNANNAFVWDLGSGEKRSLGRPTFVSDAAFSPDGTELVTLGRPSDKAFVKVLALSDLTERARLRVPPLTRALAYPGGDGGHFAIGGGASGNGYLHFVSREPLALGDRFALPSPPEPIHAAATAPVVVTVSYEGFIRVFDARTGLLGGTIVPVK